ncbi:hypothetical protein E4U21_002767, partial [Claviceps maximensis]
MPNPPSEAGPEPAYDAKSSPDYIQFKNLPAGGALNRWSAVLTRGHDFPGAQTRVSRVESCNNNSGNTSLQAMLYGAGIPNEEMMKSAAQVGISTVWWEGNPCKPRSADKRKVDQLATAVLEFGKIVKQAVEKDGDMLGWQFNTVGVSDAITMGGEGMRFSLQTRELIADSIESVTSAQHHDANISIAGCDKNMPGVVMAAARHNRPFIMIYGGTARRGRVPPGPAGGDSGRP